jgi:imidazolonepropionase
MKLTPEEAINALTLNAAYAMGINETHGSISLGKSGNVLITNEIPSLAYIPYAFGENHIERLIH